MEGQKLTRHDDLARLPTKLDLLRLQEIRLNPVGDALPLPPRYLTKLLENDKASRYIRRTQPEVLDQFAAIVEATALE